MNKIVWLCIFFIISITLIFTTVKIVSLQEDLKLEGNYPEQNYQERGPIFDRNGNILAMQINSWHVGLRLIDTANPDEVVTIISDTLQISIKNLQEKLTPPTRYVRVKKFITKSEYNTLMNYKKQGKLSGVQIVSVPWRRYPGNDSIAHVIGYYGEEKHGLDGIEASYNNFLNPTKNGLGNSVYLTIDSVLQKSIEQIVKETLEESKSSYITTILMDAKTGDILAYVDEPSFDLNKYYTYPQSTLTNNIITNNYEPGSVFKVFSMASVLDAGIITEDTQYDASHAYIDPQYNFKIQDIHYPGIINTTGIIKYSSNVGVSLATYNIDNNILYNYLHNFGFGQKTGITLPGESSGILNNLEYWSARSKPTIALGQEIAVTAIQIATASTALTNKGMLLVPNLVQKIIDPTGTVIYQSSPQYKRQVIQESTATSMLKMMNAATESDGTARRLKIDGINISAKTGTAQVFDRTKNEYSKSNFIASTLSIVPTENPELIIYAVIHNPTSGEIYGGRTTAPMIRKMLKFILPYLGLAGNRVDSSVNNTQLSRYKKINQRNTLYYDDYTGLSKREVWPLFANSDISVNIYGTGKVVNQDPKPGTLKIEKKYIKLYLE